MTLGKHTHESYMQRCLELARLGAGSTLPNPMVGSVVVHEGKIVGEGFHRAYGGPHAEVNAINQVKDERVLKASTLYVNLEPCAHHGKTPPCSDLILKRGIPRVVVGMRDPFDQVDGKGIERLRAAGVDVTVGVLEQQAQALNRAFTVFHTQQRPFVILKWAESADGLLDRSRTSANELAARISNPGCTRYVHRLRSESHAILVGRETARLDNPALTTRLWPGLHPQRVVLDPSGTLPESLSLLQDDQSTWIMTRTEARASQNNTWIHIPESDFLSGVLRALHQRGIAQLLVEGGAKTLHSFLEASRWDEIIRISARDVFLHDGPKAPEVPGKPDEQTLLDNNTLHRYVRK